MKRTNRELLLKSLKYFAFTVALMFTAPTIIYQAFKNQTHPWYQPILITGILLAIFAIIMGFYSLRMIMKSFFGDNEQSKN